MKTKHVNWSYPTSTNAENFGYGRTGCWTVSTIDHNETGTTGPYPPVAIAGFKTRAEAMAHAETLPEPWGSVASVK